MSAPALAHGTCGATRRWCWWRAIRTPASRRSSTRCPARGRGSPTTPASPSIAVRPPSTLADGRSIELTDLPGTYSLAARSREEQIAVESLLGQGPRRPDAILVVADATALARALYLTLEILEIGRPVVIALNMTDEARRDGIDIDVARLEALTGARVVPTVASKGMGTDALRAALAEAARTPDVASPARRRPVPRPCKLDLAELEGLILSERADGAAADARVWAQWLLLSLDHDVRRRAREHPGLDSRRRAAACTSGPPQPAATSTSRSSADATSSSIA